MTPTCKPIVVAMVGAGMRRGLVAKHLRITPTRVTQICGELGLPVMVRHAPKRSDLSAVRAMHAARFTDDVMARRLGCSRWSVLRMRRRMGLPGRHEGEPTGIDERHIAQLYSLAGRNYADDRMAGVW